MAGEGYKAPRLEESEKLEILSMVRRKTAPADIVAAFKGRRNRKTVMRWVVGFMQAMRPRSRAQDRRPYELTERSLRGMVDFIGAHPAASEEIKATPEAPPTDHEGRLLALAHGPACTSWKCGIFTWVPTMEAVKFFKREESGKEPRRFGEPNTGESLPFENQSPAWLVDDLYHCLADHSPYHRAWRLLEAWRSANARYLEHLLQMLLDMRAEVRTTAVVSVEWSHSREGFDGRALTDLIDYMVYRHLGRGPAQDVWTRPQYRSEADRLYWGSAPIMRVIAKGDAAFIARARKVHRQLVERWLDSVKAPRLMELYRSADRAGKQALLAFGNMTLQDIRYGRCRICIPTNDASNNVGQASTVPTQHETSLLAARDALLTGLVPIDPVAFLARCRQRSFDVEPDAFAREAGPQLPEGDTHTALAYFYRHTDGRVDWLWLRWWLDDSREYARRFAALLRNAHRIAFNRARGVVSDGVKISLTDEYDGSALERAFLLHLGRLTPEHELYSPRYAIVGGASAGESHELRWGASASTRLLATGDAAALGRLGQLHERMLHDWAQADTIRELVQSSEALEERRTRLVDSFSRMPIEALRLGSCPQCVWV